MCDWWDEPESSGGNLMDQDFDGMGLPPPLLQASPQQIQYDEPEEPVDCNLMDEDFDRIGLPAPLLRPPRPVNQWWFNDNQFANAQDLFRYEPSQQYGYEANRGYQCGDFLDIDPCAPSAGPIGSPQAYYPGIATIPNWTDQPIPDELMRMTPEDGTPYGTPPGMYNMDGCLYPLSGSGALKMDRNYMGELLQQQVSAPYMSQPYNAAKYKREELMKYHMAQAAPRRRLMFGGSPPSPPSPEGDAMKAVRIQQAIERSMIESNLPAHMSNACVSASTETEQVRRKFVDRAMDNVTRALEGNAQPQKSLFKGLQPSRPYSPERKPKSPETERIWKAEQLAQLEKVLEELVGQVKLKKAGDLKGRRSPAIKFSSPQGDDDYCGSSTTPTVEREVRFQRQVQANLHWFRTQKGLTTPVRPTSCEPEDREAIGYLTEMEGYRYSPQAHGSTWAYPPRGRLHSPHEDDILVSSDAPTSSSSSSCEDCRMQQYGHMRPKRVRRPRRPRERTRFLNWTAKQKRLQEMADAMEAEACEAETQETFAMPGPSCAPDATFAMPGPSCAPDATFAMPGPSCAPDATFAMPGPSARASPRRSPRMCPPNQDPRFVGMPTRETPLNEWENYLRSLGVEMSPAESAELLAMQELEAQGPLRAPSPCRSPQVEAVTPPGRGMSRRMSLGTPDSPFSPGAPWAASSPIRAVTPTSMSPLSSVGLPSPCRTPRRALHELPAHKRPGAESFTPSALGTETFTAGLRPALRKGPMKSMLPPPSGSTRPLVTTRRIPVARPSIAAPPNLSVTAPPCPETPRRSGLTALPAHRMPGYKPEQGANVGRGVNAFSQGLRTGLSKGPTMLSGRKTVPGPVCPPKVAKPSSPAPAAPQPQRRSLCQLPAHKLPGAQPPDSSMAAHASSLRSNIYKRTSAPKPLMRKKPPC